LIAHGKIIRPGLAVGFAPDEWMQRIGLDGVLVLSIEPNSSASDAGLRPTQRDPYGNIYLGDIITAVDQAPVRSRNDLLTVFEHHKVGDRVTLTVVRKRERIAVDVRLEAVD
jgi:S1-C subfamily serine protease